MVFKKNKKSVVKANKEELKIDYENLPAHIGFIMDGNRRWARKRGLPTLAGHREGAEALKRIVKRASEIGIVNLSFFCFSIENFKRSKEEVDYLFKLINEILDLVPDLIKIGYKFHHSGDKSLLPKETQEQIAKIEEKTKDCNKGVLNLLIAYGGRHDIVCATKKIIEQNVKAEDITEETFKNFLTTSPLPDLDLLVRTSGEHRISGFMLYDMAYAEIYFVNKHWPDFKGSDLDDCVIEFQKRNRRFGK